MRSPGLTLRRRTASLLAPTRISLPLNPGYESV
jgi:hypothetical protein